MSVETKKNSAYPMNQQKLIPGVYFRVGKNSSENSTGFPPEKMVCQGQNRREKIESWPRGSPIGSNITRDGRVKFTNAPGRKGNHVFKVFETFLGWSFQGGRAGPGKKSSNVIEKHRFFGREKN